MITKKESKKHFIKTFFGCFFAILGVICGIMAPIGLSANTFADPESSSNISEVNVPATPDPDSDPVPANEVLTDSPESDEGATEAEAGSTVNTAALTSVTGDRCQDDLGSIGWLVCPTTGKIAEAVDWLYDKLEDILVINPVSIKEGSPIFQIWQYFLGITNIIFIIFLLVVVYSQITGVGISNYGIKKVLPKLIVTAVLINLSFLICIIAVDISNIIGNGLRGVFTGIEE